MTRIFSWLLVFALLLGPAGIAAGQESDDLDRIPAAAEHRLEAVSSQLSPAIVYRSTEPTLRLLSGLPEHFGLAGPRQAAWYRTGQVRVAAVGDGLSVPCPGNAYTGHFELRTLSILADQPLQTGQPSMGIRQRNVSLSQPSLRNWCSSLGRTNTTLPARMVFSPPCSQ